MENNFIKSISLPDEEWRNVVDYDGYMVSNFARIACVKTSYTYHKNGKAFIKKCKPHLCSTSIAPSTMYRRITFRFGNKHSTELVHRIVAKAFVDNPNNYNIVDHIDDNPSNNNASNLQWCTYKFNNSKDRHRRLTSLSKIGRVDPKRKPILSYKDNVVEKQYESISAAEADGHCRSAIQRVLKGDLKTHHGLSWKYLHDQ